MSCRTTTVRWVSGSSPSDAWMRSACSDMSSMMAGFGESSASWETMDEDPGSADSSDSRVDWGSKERDGSGPVLRFLARMVSMQMLWAILNTQELNADSWRKRDKLSCTRRYVSWTTSSASSILPKIRYAA